MGIAARIKAAFAAFRFTGGTQGLGPWIGTAGAGSPIVRSDSGELVDPLHAMSLAAYFSAIRVLSEDIAKLPLNVYRQEPRGRVLAATAPIARLLKRPNEENTAFTLVRLAMIHVLAWGNAFIHIQRDGAGRPVALVPVEPWRVIVEREAESGRLRYRVEYSTGAQYEGGGWIDREDMIHVLGFTVNGATGISVAEYAGQSLGIGLAQQGFESAFYKNGIRPTGVLTHPEKLSEEAQIKLKASFDRANTGRNRGGSMVLEEGMTFHQLQFSNVDAQFLESRKFLIEEVARWFRIPPYKLGHVGESNGSVEEAALDYLDSGLQMHIRNIEEEFNRKLLPDGGVEIAFDPRIIMHAPAETRANYAVRLVQHGILTPNEARDIEGMNPHEDEAADKLYAQQQLQPLGQAPNGGGFGSEPEDDDEDEDTTEPPNLEDGDDDAENADD